MAEKSFDDSDDMFEDYSMEESDMLSKQEQCLSGETNIIHVNTEKTISDLKHFTPDSLVNNNSNDTEKKEIVTDSECNKGIENISEVYSDHGLLTEGLKSNITNIPKKFDLFSNNIVIDDEQTQSGIHNRNTLSSHCKMLSPSDESASKSMDKSVVTDFDNALSKEELGKSSTGTHAASNLIEPQGTLTSTLDDYHSGYTAENGDLSVTCPFCGLSLFNLTICESHIEYSHPENSHVDMVDLNNTGLDHGIRMKDNRDSYDFLGVCPYCDQDLGNEINVQLHITAVHEENFHHNGASVVSCPLCDFVCSSEEDLKKHLRTHNTDATVYGVSSSHEKSSEMTCPVCGLSMTDPDLLNSHVESHFNPKHSTGSAFSQFKVDTNNFPQKSSSKDVAETAGSKINSTEKNFHHVSTDTSNVPHVNVKSWSSKDIMESSSSKVGFQPSAGKENSTYKKMYEQNLQKAVVRGQISVPEYHEQIRSMKQNDLKGVDDGSTRVSGLIQKLENVYKSQARPGQNAILCFPTDHYSASFGDKGWGCGYRNFQMLLSCLSLVPEYAAKLFHDQQRHIPSIPKIQEMIESAWQKGFDPQGCNQLNGKLINTKKWIGATEIIATLSWLGIKCQLADFHTPSSDDGTHPRLLEWVSDHFRKCQSQGLCKAPLYLQHQGHSRTIIGVENDRGVTKLLLFDPGTPKDQLMTLAGSRLSWKDLRAFRRTQAGFRAKQYQIVAIIGLLSKHEYEESKILKSERVS